LVVGFPPYRVDHPISWLRHLSARNGPGRQRFISHLAGTAFRVRKGLAAEHTTKHFVAHPLSPRHLGEHWDPRGPTGTEEDHMKRGPYIALAVGFGYLLGRRRRLTTALALGAAAAVGRASSSPGGLLRRGAQALGSSPERTDLAGLGGPLIRAGKAAAKTAVSSRVDSLSDRLRQRSDGLRRPVRPEEGRPGEDGPGDEDVGQPRRSAPAEAPDEDEFEEPYAEDVEDEVAARQELTPGRQRGSGRQPAAPRQRRRPDERDDEDEELDDEGALEASPRTSRPRRTTGGAPVRRRGR
jgi:hypothetical protein